MRVLLLVLQFPPDVNSTGLLMAQLGEGLVARGHAVSVVTTFPHYDTFRVWDGYRGKLAERDQYRGMEVLRLWVYASGQKQRMKHRLASYLSYNALATLATLVAPGHVDVILCTNGSFFTGISAFVGGAPRRIPFVYNVQDLYPETPVSAGQLRNPRAIAVLERLERFMYGRAAHTTVITPSFRENLLGKGVPPDRVSVIPNFVDTDFIRPLPRANAFSERLGLAGKFVITHAGNLGYVYDLATLLDAAALLAREKDLLFLLVGEGVARADLERKAQALQLDNVRFLPFQPREALPWLRASSDLPVSLYRRGAARYSMPSKIYEIMASGRPLLASADAQSDVWNLVTATGCGRCVEPEDPEQLAEAILQLSRDPATREAMAQRGRQEAVDHYSAAAVVAQYEALLANVAGRSARAARPR